MRGSTACGWAMALLTSASLAACTDPGPSGQALWTQACTLPPSTDELPADQQANALMWQARCHERYAAIAAESPPAADALARCVIEERKSSKPSKHATIACVGESHRALIERIIDRLDAQESPLADAYRNMSMKDAAEREAASRAKRSEDERGAAEEPLEVERGD